MKKIFIYAVIFLISCDNSSSDLNTTSVKDSGSDATYNSTLTDDERNPNNSGKTVEQDQKNTSSQPQGTSGKNDTIQKAFDKVWKQRV